VGEAVQSVVKTRVGRSPQQLEAIETFERRMSDPATFAHEWAAIKERHGVEGVLKYMDEMSKLTEETE
jgi:hypothetical protein